MQDLTLKETAKMLSVTYNHLYELCRKGEFPAYQVGRSWRVNPEEIKKFKEKQYFTNKTSKVETCQSTNEENIITLVSGSRASSYEKARARAIERSRSNSKQS